ncbi:hypothetical protein [Cryptosporangium minutisporangium]|uniref:Peptidase inhibitor family I36 n=1 Tax=Cryptosporangium minutisporangium TaxID=113569 RepID=A0ABP6SU60_9ACTN
MVNVLRSARRTTSPAGPAARAKKPFFLTLFLATIATAGLLSAVPAQAETASGCTYPRVCFYPTVAYLNANRPTASYRDITPSWQNLGYQARGAAVVYNSRNDDGARLHFTNGTTVCVKPGVYVNAAAYGTVDKIRIMDSANC